MAISPIHSYFILNDELKPVSEFIPQKYEGGVYEVLRVEKAVPLFLEDHLKRLRNSAQISGINLNFSDKQIKSLLSRLISANKVNLGNILISLKEDFKAFFLYHKYPENELYKSGVDCGILRAERKNPTAKIFQTSVREQADNLMKEKNYYEVLLVDNFGRITEGSRSNVFFINDNRIITPPGNVVLPGITRTKTIQAAGDLEINVQENDVYTNDLENFESVFITGTSPKILPVKQIGSVKFNAQNKILQQLIFGYDQLIEEYISRNKN